MAPLQNSSIEFPKKLFEVELIVGTAERCHVIKRTIQVLAQTAKGARRICRARYQYGEIARSREAVKPHSPPMRDLLNWDACLSSY